MVGCFGKEGSCPSGQVLEDGLCVNTFLDEELNEIPTLQLNDYGNGFTYSSKTPLTEAEIVASDLDTVSEEDYEVSYERVTATTSYQDLMSFGMNNDIYYPGALIDFTDMNPIQANRNPIDISISLETATNTGSGSISVTVDDPKLSTIREGIRTLVSGNITQDTNMPARITYELREINSIEELSLNAGFAIQKGIFAGSISGGYNDEKKNTNLLLVIKQIYYTIDVDLPNDKLDFFNETNESLNNMFKDGTIPTYVSSVAYGRVAMILIQSNFSKQEIEAEINASFGLMSINPGSSKNKKLSNELEISLQRISSDTDTTIKAFIYGGDSNNLNNGFITSIEDISLENIFGSYDALGSVGLPISYTFRHIDGSLAKLQESNEYIIKTIKYVPKKIMKWDFYDKLVETKEIRELTSLTIDITAIEDNVANKIVKIPSNIETMVFKGTNDIANKLIYDNLTIEISPRSKPLSIYLSNISISGFNAPAIHTSSREKISIYLVGEVDLIGSDGYPGVLIPSLELIGDLGTDVTIIGGKGVYNLAPQPGIYSIDVLTIDMKDTLTIVGGNGRDGLDGISYNRSDNARYDVDGEDGGDGERGQDGSVTVKAGAINIITYGSLHLTLRTGDGGNGGNGGDGQFAGMDKSPTAVAGDGGDGGDGGLNGDIFDCINLNINGQFQRITIDYGKPGNSGSGGDGGHADQAWVIVLVKWSEPGNGGLRGSVGYQVTPNPIVYNTLQSSVSESNFNVTFGIPGQPGENGEKGDKDHF